MQLHTYLVENEIGKQSRCTCRPCRFWNKHKARITMLRPPLCVDWPTCISKKGNIRKRSHFTNALCTSASRHMAQIILRWLIHYRDWPNSVSGVNSNLKLLISAISKVSRVGKFKLAHSSASLKFPRTSVPKTLSLLSCSYKPSYLLSASIAPAPCVFREAEGPAFTGFAARSWKTPARRFSRRR